MATLAAGGAGALTAPVFAAVSAPLDESVPVSASTGSSQREKKAYAEMQDLYAVLVATEYLEGAFARGAIRDEDYKRTYIQYQKAYDMHLKALTDLKEISSIHSFVSEYGIELPKALNRLEIMHIPATDEHFSTESLAAEPVLCVETTGVLITTQDQVKLNQVEVDMLAPAVSVCLDSLNKHTWLKDFEPKTKLQEWVRLFSTMRASDALNEEQARQLAYDLGQALDGFRDRLDKLLAKKA